MRGKQTRRGLGVGVAALGLACATSLLGVRSDLGAAEPQTKVAINGKPAPVFFNDGDSFRVLSGTFNGAKARLAGYNTLESHGAVHQWGSWTAKELYVLAKMATLNARDKAWSCETDGKTDTYGRMLLWCPELATEQVRLGFAHAMSIDDNPAKPELVEAQREAIENRAGMWAHGVPDFVLTSLHSAEEDTDGKGTYNRLVSTKDGHSVKWKHTTKYRECENVCQEVFEVDEAKVDEVSVALSADNKAKRWVGKLTPVELRSMVYDFAKFRHINRTVKKDHREKLLEHLMKNYAAQGRFGEQPSAPASCMIHVPFERRFGGARATCLK